jgi:membrane-associated phospholipid phosphatase
VSSTTADRRHAPASSGRLQEYLVLPRGRNDFARQLAIWLGFAAAYQVARGLADRGSREAFANARRVIDLEQSLGALFEPRLQQTVVHAGGVLVHTADWTYWLSQFVAVGLALLWIYLRRNDAYLRVRNALIVANTIGLAWYIALPTAPPRLFPGLGFTDTLAHAEALNHGSGLVRLASNPFAAMPSLHAADALIIGLALAATARHAVPKLLFLAWPAWVAFSLVVTANHFWLDIVAGVAVALTGRWVAGSVIPRSGVRHFLRSWPRCSRRSVAREEVRHVHHSAGAALVTRQKIRLVRCTGPLGHAGDRRHLAGCAVRRRLRP